jgi:hypothetical protein
MNERFHINPSASRGVESAIPTASKIKIIAKEYTSDKTMHATIILMSLRLIFLNIMFRFPLKRYMVGSSNTRPKYIENSKSPRGIGKTIGIANNARQIKSKIAPPTDNFVSPL